MLTVEPHGRRAARTPVFLNVCLEVERVCYYVSLLLTVHGLVQRLRDNGVPEDAMLLVLQALTS